ncbi:hypothetical protein [Halorubrum sp. FL23]|uniref:hypothetical protein n=1 Tax=Halorubrum sp. FL23 TaxID=3458704 RepID=UPI004034BA89
MPEIDARLSAAVSGERAEYVEYRVEDGDSKTQIVRDALDALIERDGMPGDAADDPDIDESDEDVLDTASDSDLVIEPSKSGADAVNLADPDDDFFDPDVSTPVTAPNLTGWKESDAIASTYSDNKTGEKGRKHVYLSVIEEMHEPTRLEVLDAIQKLGVEKVTAERALKKLVREGHLYAHPTTPEGLFTDELMERIRLKLADKRRMGDAESALTDKEKIQYPDDWSHMVFGYDELVRKVYYTDKQSYLRSLVKFVNRFLVTSLHITPTQWKSDSIHTSLTADDQTTVMNTIDSEILRLLEAEFGDDFGDAGSEFSRIMAHTKRLNENDKGTQEYADLWGDMKEYLNTFRDVADSYDDASESSDRSVHSDSEMSVSDAREVMEMGDGDLTEDRIDSQYRELASERHPDVGDTSEAFIEVKNAKDVLMDAA